MLAIKAQNARAVKDLLENDQAVNLRESLKGPKDLYNLENENWIYTFKVPGADEVSELSQPFSNLGIALLVDC